MIRLTTLGGLAVVRDGENAGALLKRRVPLALLIYLAAEREASRESVLAVFWGNRDPERARHSLSQALYDLTSHLGDGWLAGRRDIVRASDELTLDATEFETAAGAGDVEAALDLYRGHFLDGFGAGSVDFEHWTSARRAALERTHRRLMRDVVNDAIASGRLPSALEQARQWATIHPFDDEAHHRLIELLAAGGDRSGAIASYERYRRFLAADDLRPLEQTIELVDRIRAGNAQVSASGLTSAPAVASDPATGGSAEAPTDSSEPERAVVTGRTGRPGEGQGEERTEDPPRTRALGGAPISGPRLVRIAEGGREAESYALRRGRTAIGRDRGDLVFPGDMHLSGLHATISARPVSVGEDELRFVLRDAGSRNGVFVRVTSPWPLRDGDWFAVGRQRFRLEIGDAASSPEG